jgi:hypothetical protein
MSCQVKYLFAALGAYYILRYIYTCNISTGGKSSMSNLRSISRINYAG